METIDRKARSLAWLPETPEILACRSAIRSMRLAM